MALVQILTDFKSSVAQCDNLIANAHRTDAAGAPLLPVIDQRQITVAAFLNFFIAWESFLEATLADVMTGAVPTSGNIPVKFVAPPTIGAANEMIIGVMRYFDYANHSNVRKIVRMYFQTGYPFEPHMGAIFSDLDDLRTMRNASAHISTPTQAALEALATRIFGQPRPGITLYQLITAIDPRSGQAREPVFITYKNKLRVTAELIAAG